MTAYVKLKGSLGRVESNTNGILQKVTGERDEARSALSDERTT